MNRIASTARPDWVSDHLFPFESRFLALPAGHRMHYIDEGNGEPLVFVHGNPAWSFEFRHPVRELRSECRGVALDHIGFGLSSRSARREDHRPQSHAHRLAALLDHLDLRDLRDITLFMNDWGGRSASTSRAGTRSASRVSSSRTPGAGRSWTTSTSSPPAS